MGNIDIKQVSFNSISQIGKINDKRIEKLSKNLFDSTDFKNHVRIPVGVVFISKSQENLVIAQDRISYTSVGSDINKSSLLKALSIVSDVLMLEENNSLIIDIQGTSKAIDSHKESIEYFKNKESGSFREDIYGIGYRFLVKNTKGTGELKIEPLVKDSHFYFYEYIMNYINKISNEDIVDILLEEVKEFEIKFKDIKYKK